MRRAPGVLLALLAASHALHAEPRARPAQAEGAGGADETAPAPAPGALEPRADAPRTYFFSLEADAAPGVLREAVEKLGPGARVVFGPGASETRPQVVFYAVEAPAAVSALEVVRAMKKGARTVEPLRATTLDFAFIDPAGELFESRAGIPGLREIVIGLAGELRWCTLRRRSITFYHTSKIDAEKLQQRAEVELRDWQEGLRSVDVHTETVRWTLAAPVAEAAARACERKLGKLPFVRTAAIDAAAGVLDLTVTVADLEVSGPMLALGPVEPGQEEQAQEPGGPAPEQMDLAPLPPAEPLLAALREAGLALR